MNDNDSKGDNLKDKAENQFSNQKERFCRSRFKETKASEKVSDNKTTLQIELKTLLTRNNSY